MVKEFLMNDKEGAVDGTTSKAGKHPVPLEHVNKI